MVEVRGGGPSAIGYEADMVTETSGSADIFTKEKRSRVMSRIRSRDTQPEMVVRRVLHGMGYRYRLHAPKLPGKPDIVLPRYRTVVLVHGCFWHLHEGCSRAKLPATRREWWRKKLERNAQRDSDVVQQLASAGWGTVVVWQCELRDVQAVAKRLNTFLMKHEGGG